MDVLYVVTGEHKPLPAESVAAEDAELLEQYQSLSEGDREAVRRLVSALAATKSMRPA
ncbi:hypothetical protein D3C84_1072960 [compost metagenome]